MNVPNEIVEKQYEAIYGKQETSDVVNSPDHYKHGKFETIEEMLMLFSKEEVMAFCKLNAYKYKARAPFKGNMEEDLKKADRYFEMLKELEKR